MKARHLATLLFTALIVGSAAKVAALWPQLPERVATHFDTAGRPNGWHSRSELVVVLLVLLALFVASFASTGLVHRIPDRHLNLPGKAHWLAPERRDETLGWLRDWMRWFLLVTFAFVGGIILLALDANSRTPPLLALPAWAIAAFALVVIAMLVALLWRLRTGQPKVST